MYTLDCIKKLEKFSSVFDIAYFRKTKINV